MSQTHFFTSMLKAIDDAPKYIKITSGLYLLSVTGYNFVTTYANSKMFLDKFREKKLDTLTITVDERISIKDDWSAVTFGANYGWWDRFIESFIWPITLSKNVIPWLVMILNKKTD